MSVPAITFGGPSGAAPLPPLRDDLRLFEAGANRDGSPAWAIQDPARNRFFRVGWLEFEILARWDAGSASAIVEQLGRETPLAATEEDVEALVAFLSRNQLLRARFAADSTRLAALRRTLRPGWLKGLLHHYLFFRVPMVRPGRFLERTLPWVAFVFRPAFFVAVGLATLAGIVLAARQWDVFTHTFAQSLSPAGLIGYLAALAFAKSLHELAHAYTATRYGVRVGHMGVAFVVLLPMLYTDTGETWKLAESRRRFAIAAAGVTAELILAGLATLGWSLAPDGPVRQALFFLATTSWILSVGINASPFMRFDGYFLLSDALDLPNLHERSFALARAALRHTLFGFTEPDPEAFPPRMRRMLVAFAFATWVWRLLVFVGIALAVYHFFFKALGIVLLAVELGWFVARPVAAEFRVWWQRRGEIRASRRLVWLASISAIALVLLFPWRESIHAPAVARAEHQVVLYSPLPARLAETVRAGPVDAGETLLVLDSPDIRSRAEISRVSAATLSRQLERLAALPEGEERRAILARELAREIAEVKGELAELARLEIKAPFAGEVLDIDPHLARGVWVKPLQPLAVLVDPAGWIVEALVEEAGVARIATGSAARFYARDTRQPPLAGTVETIDTARAATVPHVALAASHGGPIETVEGERLVPRAALYRVRIRLEARPDTKGVALGSAVIEGRRESLLADWLRSIASVLVRESGF